jgi:hypothetical protein
MMPTADRAIINLEHVLPKKPEENWPQFTSDEVALYTNRLGNQALLRASDNSDLKSMSFKDKKKVYKQSPYVLTSQIANLADWSPTTNFETSKGLRRLGFEGLANLNPRRAALWSSPRILLPS